MGRKTPLSSQTTRVNIVIRKNIALPIPLIKQYCVGNFKKYAFIEHKGHIKVDTGEVEGIHYHIVGDYSREKVPLSTRLNTICKFFKFDNTDGIQIEKYDSFEASLQYLTHKNQPEKTQMDKSAIIHNLSNADFEILYNCEIGNIITFDLIFSICMSSSNITDVIRQLGIGNYRLWRSVVWDIWNDLRSMKLNQQIKIKS